MSTEQPAAREFRKDMLPVRPGRERVDADGCWASWDDGTQTYTLQWGPAAAPGVFGRQIADEMAYALSALEAIRAGDTDRLRDPAFLSHAMSQTRRIRLRLEAVEEELLLQARDTDPTGKATLSWRAAGSELHQHHTTVKERWDRSTGGQHAEFREWLVQELAPYVDPAPGAAHHTEVYDVPDEPGKVQARCRCDWKSEPMKNIIAAALAGKSHVAEHEQ